MNKLTNLLKEMGNEIPGLSATAIVGMDGLPVAQYSTATEFDIEIAAAQFALIMKSLQKTCDQLGANNVEDNFVTTANSYLMTLFLGDGCYYLVVAVDKNSGNLGNLRLIAKQFADALWNAIPKKK